MAGIAVFGSKIHPSVELVEPANRRPIDEGVSDHTGHPCILQPHRAGPHAVQALVPLQEGSLAALFRGQNLYLRRQGAG